MPVDGWRIHRRIGMSGGLFARAVAREIGRSLTDDETEALQRRHGEIFREILPDRRPLPGAVELLAALRAGGIVHGIATSGRRPEIDASLEALGIPADMVVVERGDVLRAKPEPDLFLACQERLGVAIGDCYVVGDAVWDLLAARRAGMLSVGLLTGGYGEDELRGAGAFRVYRDAAELLEFARRARDRHRARPDPFAPSGLRQITERDGGIGRHPDRHRGLIEDDSVRVVVRCRRWIHVGRSRAEKGERTGKPLEDVGEVLGAHQRRPHLRDGARIRAGRSRSP